MTHQPRATCHVPRVPVRGPRHAAGAGVAIACARPTVNSYRRAVSKMEVRLEVELLVPCAISVVDVGDGSCRVLHRPTCKVWSRRVRGLGRSAWGKDGRWWRRRAVWQEWRRHYRWCGARVQVAPGASLARLACGSRPMVACRLRALTARPCGSGTHVRRVRCPVTQQKGASAAFVRGSGTEEAWQWVGRLGT